MASEHDETARRVANGWRNQIGEQISKGYLLMHDVRPENVVRADLAPALEGAIEPYMNALIADEKIAAVITGHEDVVRKEMHEVALREREMAPRFAGVANDFVKEQDALELLAAGDARFPLPSDVGAQHLRALQALAVARGLATPETAKDLVILQAQLVWVGDELKKVRFLGASDFHNAPQLPDGKRQVRVWGTKERPDHRVVDGRVAPAIEDIGNKFYSAALVDGTDGGLALAVCWNLEDTSVIDVSSATPKPHAAQGAVFVGTAMTSAIEDLLIKVQTISDEAVSSLLVKSVQRLAVTVLTDDKTPLKAGAALRAFHSPPPNTVIIFGDINRFKKLNDEAGHAAGDAAIAKVGQTVNGVIAPYAATAFRQSGDEFVIIVADHHLDRLLADLASACASMTLTYDARQHQVSMSFGWSRSADGEAIETALKRADTACQVAKLRGDGAVVKWEPSMMIEETVTRRFRCASCGLRFNVSIAPAETRPVKCPLCGHPT